MGILHEPSFQGFIPGFDVVDEVVTFLNSIPR